jgi:hypothetical protein
MAKRKKDPLELPTVTVTAVPIGVVETPTITVSDVPTTANVGDRIKPKVKVERPVSPPVPVVGCPVDFFVKDALGVMVLGDRVKTDSAGEAVATEFYYVGKPDAGLSIEFIIVTRPIFV